MESTALPKPRPRVTGPESTNLGLALPPKEQAALKEITDRFPELSKSEAVRWAIIHAANYLRNHAEEG